MKRLILALAIATCIGTSYAGKTVSVASVDGQTTFVEGDTVNFTVSLSEANDTGMALYAFLLCGDDVDLSIFSGTTSSCIITNTLDAQSNTRGLAINAFLSSVSGIFKVLDGGLGVNYSFSVVLCSSSSYDPVNRITSYAVGDMMDISVNNAEPTIRWIELNGWASAEDGYTFTSPVAMGVAQTFCAVVADSGRYDLANDVEGKRFQTKWTCIRGGVTKYSQIVYGNPNESTFSYAFPMAGTWTVRCQIKDKDMEDWSDATYSVNLDVVAPCVVVTAPETLSETDTRQSVQIGVSYWDGSVLTARVEVVESSPGRQNPGLLKLDSSFASQIPGEENVYYVELRDGSVNLYIESMDGTGVSSIYGFTIKASIVSSGIDYAPWQHRIYINNVAPVCDATYENSSAWVVVPGVASYSIRWQVRNDVEGDFAGTASFPGVKVSFRGCDNEQSFYVTGPSRGVFAPSFGMKGSQTVTLTIEDKDGAMQCWTYQYEVRWPEVLTPVGSDAEAQEILSEFADTRIAENVSTVGEYNQLAAWANDKNIYQPALKDSAHAWASYVLGAEAILANEPEIEIGDMTVVTGEDGGSLGSASPTMTVSVSVKDGERAVAVDANSVAGMFEATSNLSDWTGAALPVDVEVVDDGASSSSHQMRFKATPGDSPSQAFLRIRK